MRITVVTETYPPEINGVALTVARGVGYLRERGHEVDVVRPAQPGEARGPSAAALLTRGGPLPFYPDLRYGLAMPATLVDRFAASGAQLVHVATEGQLGWAAVSAAIRQGIPVTSDFRTNFPEYARHYGLGWLAPTIAGYLRHFHNRTALTFVPTEQTRRTLAARGHERLAVVGRGVDLERFHPQRRDPALRDRFVGSGGPLLLHVGRLAAEKNVRLALRAYRAARRTVPDTRMVVIGDGPLRERLALEFDDVSFLGALTGDSLAIWYASADLFLFPSVTDTFGNVTLEALASGLPVIAYDLAAASEHVCNRISGRLVEPDNEADFLTATAELVGDACRFPELGAAARRSAERVGWPSVLDAFETRLLAVLPAASQPAVAEACAA